MKTKKTKHIWTAASFLVVFTLWTAAASSVDVQPIGPNGSSVGFATINCLFHEFIGNHISLYIITDWLSVIPLGFILAFSCLGLMQWIKRKHILKIDHSLLALGCFYIVVISLYLTFELFVVNFRPVLINGRLEASYPSSTTILVLCIIPTTVMQCNCRIKHTALQHIIALALILFAIFMVISRLISGVHWLSDIIGGCLLSAGLDSLYFYACEHI